MATHGQVLARLALFCLVLLFYPAETVTPKTKLSKGLQKQAVVTGYLFPALSDRRPVQEEKTCCY
jgi:hypothetical protein